MSILKKVNETYGVTVIANLHHLEYAKEYCNRIIGVNDGTVVFDDKSEKLTEELVEKIYANNEKA